MKQQKPHFHKLSCPSCEEGEMMLYSSSVDFYAFIWECSCGYKIDHVTEAITTIVKRDNIGYGVR